MNRFWKDIIEPCLITSGAKVIVEVGCDWGRNTNHLIAYCKEHGGFLHIIDPAPRINVVETYKNFEGSYEVGGCGQKAGQVKAQLGRGDHIVHIREASPRAASV